METGELVQPFTHARTTGQSSVHMLASLFLTCLTQQSVPPPPVALSPAREAAGSTRRSLASFESDFTVRAIAPDLESSGPQITVRAVEAATGKPIQGAELRWCRFEVSGPANKTVFLEDVMCQEHLQAVATLPAHGVTEAGGLASLKLPAEASWLMATSGTSWSFTRVSKLSRQPPPCELALSPVDRVQVHVQTPQGAALSGLPIRIHRKLSEYLQGPFETLAFTDSSGRAELLVPASWWNQTHPVEATVAGPGYEPQALDPQAKNPRWELLEPGTVVFSTQPGLDASKIEIESNGLRFQPDLNGVAVVWPIAPGTRPIRKIHGRPPVEVNHLIRLPRVGSWGSSAPLPLLGPGERVHELIEPLIGIPKIRLRVLNPDRSPARHRRVWLHHDEASPDRGSFCGTGQPLLDSTYLTCFEYLSSIHPIDPANPSVATIVPRELWFTTDSNGYVSFPISEDWRHIHRLGILSVYDGLPEDAKVGAQMQIHLAGKVASTDVGEIQLRPFGRIVEGQVVDLRHQPVPGIPFEVRERRPDWAPQSSAATDEFRRNTVRRFDSYGLHTDSEGRFRFEGFPRGCPVDVVIGFERFGGVANSWNGRQAILRDVPEGSTDLRIVLPDAPPKTPSKRMK